ncbi:MAG: T9SS type A sorting domain-containing protein, partial [Fulvivirga sp.]|uniref:T9SS type A sorting domain-containing protein n=1 Tax=Fulvivirga sp. TaxID=1931237 RepID=UPI0032EDA4C1
SLQTFQGKTFISILDPSYSQTVTTYNPNQNGSMDVTPGSTFNTGEIMYEKFDKAFKDAGLFVSWSAYQPNHSFIPSVSALAFESSNFLWKNPINRNLICTNEIPFDSYFAPAVNESHIQLTNDNVDWVLQEINGIPQQPTVRPMAIDLVGPETSCGTATYTFTSCSTVGSASWSVSPNLQIVSSTGNSISVKSKYSSYSGSQTITATFSNGISMNKSIVLGPPNYQNIELSVDNNELSNCDYTYADADYDHPPGPSPAILEYEWRIPYSYDWDIYEEYGGFADFQYVEIEYWDSNPPNQEAIQIRARNTCGWSWWKEFWVDVDDCGGYFMMMSPNPSSDFLNISFQRAELESLNAKEVTTTRIPEKNIISEIYDQHQNLVLMQDGEMNTGLTIDTSQLQPGRYIIKVYVDDQIFTRHLLIE